MKDNKNIVIAVLLLVIGGLLGALIGRPPSPPPPEAEDPAMAAPMDGPGAKRPGRSAYETNQVRNTLTKNDVNVRECYQEFVKVNPPITDGRVMLDWQIDSDGDVIKADIVTSEINNPVLHDCLIKVFKGIEFPPPPGDKPVYASFTYVFKKDPNSPADPNAPTPAATPAAPAPAPVPAQK